MYPRRIPRIVLACAAAAALACALRSPSSVAKPAARPQQILANSAD